MQKLKKFLLDSFDEVKNKVSWPKYGELQSNSILVLVASLVFALVIWLMDTGYSTAMSWIYNDLLK